MPGASSADDDAPAPRVGVAADGPIGLRTGRAPDPSSRGTSQRCRGAMCVRRRPARLEDVSSD